jgi:hypothetical protein
MGVIAMVKSVVGAGDDVGDLVAQLDATRAKGIAAHQELERLEAVRLAAETFEAAEAANARIARVAWEADRLAALIPELESRLAIARSVKQKDAIAKHQAISRKRYPKFRSALLAAVEEQAAVMRERAEAERELGEHVVSIHLPRMAYAGFLYREHFDIWAGEQDRVHAEPAPKPAVTAVVAPRVAPAASRAVGVKDQRAVRRVEPASSAPRRPRNPDDTAPLAPGEMRVRVLRPGFTPGDDQPQCDGQQVIRMPSEAAKLALANGAVEIVEGESK